MDIAFLFNASSVFVTFSERFSATANSGFQSLFLTVAVSWSVCAGSFSSASLKSFSAASSESTISMLLLGMLRCIWVRLDIGRMQWLFLCQQLIVIPPCSQACTHQSQPLHFFSSIISKPVFSDCRLRFPDML